MNVEAPQLATPQRARLRIEDLLRLQGNGAADDFSKSELIDGEVLCKGPHFQRHGYVKTEVAYRIRAALGAEPLIVLIGVSIAMPPHDMPEPDIVVMRGPIGSGAVDLAQVALVIEVADTTLAIDLGRKAALYARHGIAEYWVVDIASQHIVAHAAPVAGEYAETRDIAFGTHVAATTIEHLAIETSGLI